MIKLGKWLNTTSSSVTNIQGEDKDEMAYADGRIRGLSVESSTCLETTAPNCKKSRS